MDEKSDDFKARARALRLLRHVDASLKLSAREWDVIWRIAFGNRAITARDIETLAAIAAKLEPQEALA